MGKTILERRCFGLYSLSRRPRKISNKTPDDIVVELRKKTGFCAKRLAIELKKRQGIELSHRTIRHILDGRGLTRRKSKVRVYPAHWAWEERGEVVLLQMDTKDVLDKGTLETERWDYYRKSNFSRYQWTALEGRSRVRLISYSDRLSITNGIAFMPLTVATLKGSGVKRVIEIQTDWGQEFGGDLERKIERIKQRYLYSLRARSVRIPKGRKTYNGRVERSHRTDDEEFYIPNILDIKDLEDFYKRARRWIRYYNEERVHLGIGGKTPVESFEEIYVVAPTEIMRLNGLDIGSLFTDLILWFNERVGHIVLARYR